MPTKSTVSATEAAADPQSRGESQPSAVREAQPSAAQFPTSFYQANGILQCPNGDKVRSDEAGLFCLIDGKRVPYAQ
jgi:hypothetical protein